MDFSNTRVIKDKFEAIGGEFNSPLTLFQNKLPHIKAYIFDWDGVFNNGVKQDNNGSPFSEPSSMGINMLRFSGYLKTNDIPHVFIITGENNLSAINLATREHFTAVFLNARNKIDALTFIATQYHLTPQQIAFVFDDILDLGLASKVALRFQVKRKASPLTDAFIKKNKLADYLTATQGGQHAVREVCELLIGLNGNFEQTLAERMNFSKGYQQYLALRNQLKTGIYNLKSGKIEVLNAE